MKRKLVRKNDIWFYRWTLEPLDWLHIGVVVLTVAFILFLLYQILRG